MLLTKSSAISIGKADAGVPVYVNPVLEPNTMANATLGMNMTVGPDEVKIAQKNLAQGVPVLVPSSTAKNEMESASLELPNMRVGGNPVSAAQKQGVPVHVNPSLMTDTMHDAKLDMKIVVGPDEVELKKKQMQQLVQQVSNHSKYSEMKETDLEQIVKKQILAGVTKQGSGEEAKKTLDEMKAVEDALGKRILDRLNGYGWVYGTPLYPYLPYGTPAYYDVAGLINSIYSYQDLINRYEVANAIAGQAASGIYDALKNALTPPADAKANATAPAKAKLLQLEDNIMLQVNGVPVYVNPESMIISNTQASTPLGLNIVMGPDDVSFKKTHKKQAMSLEDNVVLQVNGVPVLVNPETMIVGNTQAATNLGLVNMEIGPDEVSVVQKKSVPTKDIDDKEMKDSISGFNNKLAELKKRFKF